MFAKGKDQNAESWCNIWLGALLNALVSLHSLGLNVPNILNLLGNKAKTIGSVFCCLGGVRMCSLIILMEFLWFMNLCVLRCIYKNLNKPCDIRRGRLDNRPFTPTTIQKELLRYMGHPCRAALLIGVFGAFLTIQHYLNIICLRDSSGNSPIHVMY